MVHPPGEVLFKEDNSNSLLMHVFLKGSYEQHRKRLDAAVSTLKIYMNITCQVLFHNCTSETAYVVFRYRMHLFFFPLVVGENINTFLVHTKLIGIVKSHFVALRRTVVALLSRWREALTTALKPPATQRTPDDHQQLDLVQKLHDLMLRSKAALGVEEPDQIMQTYAQLSDIVGNWSSEIPSLPQLKDAFTRCELLFQHYNALNTSAEACVTTKADTSNVLDLTNEEIESIGIIDVKHSLTVVSNEHLPIHELNVDNLLPFLRFQKRNVELEDDTRRFLFATTEKIDYSLEAQYFLHRGDVLLFKNHLDSLGGVVKWHGSQKRIATAFAAVLGGRIKPDEFYGLDMRFFNDCWLTRMYVRVMKTLFGEHFKESTKDIMLISLGIELKETHAEAKYKEDKFALLKVGSLTALINAATLHMCAEKQRLDKEDFSNNIQYVSMPVYTLQLIGEKYEIVEYSIAPVSVYQTLLEGDAQSIKNVAPPQLHIFREYNLFNGYSCAPFVCISKKIPLRDITETTSRDYKHTVAAVFGQMTANFEYVIGRFTDKKVECFSSKLPCFDSPVTTYTQLKKSSRAEVWKIETPTVAQVLKHWKQESNELEFMKQVYPNLISRSSSNYMVIPFMECLADPRFKSLGEKDAIEVFLLAAKELQRLHDMVGVIHADIKPHNIFLGESTRVFFLDGEFSVPKAPNDELVKILGYTKGYCAPEARSQTMTCCRSDVFSLGKVFKHLAGDIKLGKLLSRMTQENFENRPFIATVVEELEAIAKEKQTLASS